MSDEIIQTGPSSFILVIRMTEEERKELEDKLNDLSWKINSDSDHLWGVSKGAKGKYKCKKCDIRTDGIPHSKEDKDRHCPICQAILQ